MSNILQEGVYDPTIFKCIFLAGGPGSGKSYVSAKVTSGKGYKFVASDVQFEHLLKKHNMSFNLDTLNDKDYAKTMDIRQKAKDISNRAMTNYIDGRLGLIFDGTGHNYDKINKLRKMCTDLGYDTYMIFVNTSLDVALQRNQARERTVAEKVVIKYWNDVQANMGKFQSLFGNSNFMIIDNNNYNDNVLNSVWKKIDKFSNAPVTNPIAKKWINDQLKNKNKLKENKMKKSELRNLIREELIKSKKLNESVDINKHRIKFLQVLKDFNYDDDSEEPIYTKIVKKPYGFNYTEWDGSDGNINYCYINNDGTMTIKDKNNKPYNEDLSNMTPDQFDNYLRGE